jgi:hypothetical protein
MQGKRSSNDLLPFLVHGFRSDCLGDFIGSHIHVTL